MSGYFPETLHLSNILLRAMAERHKDNPLTAKLRQALCENNSALFTAERFVPFALMPLGESNSRVQEIRAEIQETRTALLCAINECVNFLYQTAKNETPAPPTTI